jgi:uncharacterized surface protein with fasciclin (FAS1) repeats
MQKNLLDTAIAAGNFKTLGAAITAAHLTETMNGKGPFTVFAPNDAAFAKLPKAELDALLADQAKLKKVLTFHVVPGKLMAADVAKLKDGSKVKTVEGQELTLHLHGATVKLNDSTVTRADLDSSNGVIHAIDTVMMPS